MIPPWAQNYVGIPFQIKGRDHAGCDCWGLARLVWRERFGLEVPEYLGYADSNDPKEIEPYLAEKRAAEDYWSEIEPGKEKIGDGILIRCLKAQMHVGMVIDKGWMLHSFAGADACIEQYTSQKWKLRVMGFYRHKALA